MNEEPIATENNQELHHPDPKLNELIHQWLQQTFTMESLSDLTKAMLSDEMYLQHYGIIGLRKILANGENGPPIQPFIDANMVPRLMEFLQNDKEPYLQMEACWITSNLTSGNTQQTKVLLDFDVIPCLLHLSKSANTEIEQFVVWTFGNIAGDCVEFRDNILDQGGLNAIIDIIQRSETLSPIFKNAVWALSNFCRGKPLPKPNQVEPAIPVLCDIIVRVDDRDILSDATWALSYHVEFSSQENLNKVTQIMSKILNFISTGHLIMVTPCLNILTNSIKASKRYSVTFQQPDALSWIFREIKHNRRAIRECACLALLELIQGYSAYSDIIVANPHYIDMLIDGKFMNEDVLDIMIKIIIAIAKNSNSSQISDLVDMGVLDYLIQLSKITNKDSNVSATILKGIDIILSKGIEGDVKKKDELLGLLEDRGGLEAIERLQESCNDKVYENAFGILQKYYEGENILDPFI